MSILLDALRKSEQRERLGQTPDLNQAEPVTTVAANGRPAWLIPLVLVLLIAAIAAAVWWFFAGKAPVIPVAEPEFIGQAVPVENTGAKQVEGTNPTGGAAVVANTASNSPASKTGNNSVPSTPVAKLNRQAADDNSGNSARTVADEPAASRTARATPKSGAGQAPAKPKQAKTVESEQPAGGTQSAQAEPRPASQPVNAANNVISYWQLPDDIRDQIPALNINVLVHAKKPDDRFILMGGKRYVQGDLVVDGLRLRHIRPDRAVFGYRKYRFYVTQ